MSWRRLQEQAERGDDAALEAWLREALRAGARDVCAAALELLLERWRAQPHPELARAIAALGETLEREESRAMKAMTGKVPILDWLSLAERDDAADRSALLALLHRGRNSAIGTWVQHIEAEWPRDPRITDTLCGWLLELPFRATSSQPTWRAVFGLLRAQRDPRAAARLTPVTQPDWSWPCGATMARWLSKQVPPLMEDLQRVADTAPETEPLPHVAALADWLEGGATLTAPASSADTEPTPRPPAERLEEALAAPASPRGWCVICTELERLHDAGDLDDATLSRVDGALEGWPDSLRRAPFPWWTTLARKTRPEGHPALRVARGVAMDGGPHPFGRRRGPKMGAGKLRNLLKRTEIGHITDITAPAPLLIDVGEALCEHDARLHLPHPYLPSAAEVEALIDSGVLRRLQPVRLTERLPAPLIRRVTSEVDTHVIRSLELRRATPEQIELLSEGSWPGLDRLNLSTIEGDAVLERLTGSPLWTRAEHARLYLRGLTPSALEAFAARVDAPRLRSLELDLPAEEGFPVAAATLIERLAPQLTALYVLVREPGACLSDAIAACPKLDRLRLANPDHCEALLTLDMDTLRALHLPGEGYGEAHLRAVLTRAPRLRELALRSAFTMRCRAPVSALLQALSVAEARLERLDLSGLGIDAEILRDLLLTPHTPHLRALTLTQTGLGQGTGAALAEAPLERIEVLNLALNRLTLEDANALAGSALLRRRLHHSVRYGAELLDVHGNAVTPAGYALLKEAFGEGLRETSS